MATYRKWTTTEIDFIKNNHESIPDELLASRLSQITNTNITTAMVRRQRRKLKLSKKRGRPSKNKYIPTAVSSTNDSTVT